MHDAGFLHRSIMPDAFRMGEEGMENERDVHIWNFGALCPESDEDLCADPILQSTHDHITTQKPEHTSPSEHAHMHPKAHSQASTVIVTKNYRAATISKNWAM
jgi:hypothetical protein